MKPKTSVYRGQNALELIYSSIRLIDAFDAWDNETEDHTLDGIDIDEFLISA